MEVVAAAPRCQLLLIMLMAAMLLPGMKGSPLLVQRTVTRTFELQESIGKGAFETSDDKGIVDCKSLTLKLDLSSISIRFQPGFYLGIGILGYDTHDDDDENLIKASRTF
ncbi:hypothetical protein STEG23_011614 [Scotinomys teguina]